MMQAVNSADQLSPSMGASASSSMNGLQPAASCSTGPIPGASAASSAVSDFPNKMTSLGEVQRIIGLSLSKIQMGRNQRGGLPLHKNLLVATVLNKARDLYMQETMYMNYKMMTGQFAAAAASATNNANNNHGMQEQMHSAHQHYHNYGNIAVANAMTHVHHDMADDDMEPVEANEADYDEDSESDVEDDCDVTSVQTASANADTHTMTTNHMQYPPTTMASMLSLHMHMQQQQMQQHELQQQQQQQQQQTQPQQPSPEQPAAPILPAAVVQPQHSHQQPQQQPPPPPPQPPAVVNTNDEGFIDEPDCDCDARNFSTSESRVPFQYCYNCAPFHPSNGRGPTLVPSPCPSPTPTATSSSKAGEAGDDSGGVCSPTSPIGSCNPVLYDMDSQSTEVGSKIPEAAARGTKRRCSSSDSLEEEDGASKKRRESTETSPDTSRDESGYQSDSSQHEVSLSITPPAWNSPRGLCISHYHMLSFSFRCFIRHFAEPHAVQIQTVRFWQHLPAAVAPAPLQQVQSDPVKPWRSTKSPVWCPYSPSVSTSWLRRQPPIPATSLPPAYPSPTPAAVAVSPRLRSKGKKRRKKRSLNRRRILTVKVTLPVTVGIRVTTMRPPRRKNKPRQQPQQN